MKRWMERSTGAAEIALHGARDDADDRAQDGERQAEQHGDAEAVDQAGQHVARLVVGAQRMAPRRRLQGLAALALQHGVVAVGNRRPHDPALGLDQLLHLLVGVDGGGREIAAEGRLGIVADQRRVEAAVVVDEDRLVVGQELGEQRQEEQHAEDHQRVDAALARAEVGEPPTIERRHQPRASKSMRGSTTVYMMSPRIPMTRPIRPKK